MGRKQKIKAQRKADAQARQVEEAANPSFALTGAKRWVLLAVALGLVAMFVWSGVYRIQNPSLTMVAQQKHTADDGHDHDEDDAKAPMRMITTLMQQLKENPDDVHTLHTLGEQFMRMQQWERASSLLSRAMTVEPANLSVLNLLGICDFNLKKYREAADKFEMILELEPSSVMARYNLGILYGHFLEDKAKARGYLKAVADSPKVDKQTKAQALEELKALQ